MQELVRLLQRVACKMSIQLGQQLVEIAQLLLKVLDLGVLGLALALGLV